VLGKGLGICLYKVCEGSMWGGDGVGGEWPFFVKAPNFSRKDAMAYMPSLVPRRSGRYSVCDAWHRIVWYSS